MIYAEFASPTTVLRAAERLHELGYSRLDAYTPFPMPDVEERIGVRRSRLPLGVFLAGALGAFVAYGIIYYTNAHDYPLDVGGRPLNSLPADIPIVFETTVLFAGITAFLLAIFLSGMPRLWEPVDEVEGVERTTLDRYWLALDPSDAMFDASVLDELLRLGATSIRRSEAGR